MTNNEQKNKEVEQERFNKLVRLSLILKTKNEIIGHYASLNRTANFEGKDQKLQPASKVTLSMEQVFRDIQKDIAEVLEG